MATDKDRESSSSGPELATPSTSSPPSPLLSASNHFAPVPSAESHHHIFVLLAAIYPITIILGCLFSVIAPNGQSASYFSRKSNLFNVYFVKIGWFWTTFAFFIHWFHIRHPNASVARTKAVIRWAAATTTWYIATQWFFGPPLMDRTFTITGGACEPNHSFSQTQNNPLAIKVEEAFTAAACKIAGGKWTGGHDSSGHTFMLTHASMFLLAEILPSIIDNWSRSGTMPNNKPFLMKEWYGVHWFIWAILALWWWMLLMTSVYFHTWPEKVSGWFIALFEGGLLYAYLIPLNTQARQIFGVPTI